MYFGRCMTTTCLVVFRTVLSSEATRRLPDFGPRSQSFTKLQDCGLPLAGAREPTAQTKCGGQVQKLGHARSELPRAVTYESSLPVTNRNRPFCKQSVLLHLGSDGGPLPLQR